MKTAISNIAWEPELDKSMYTFLQNVGVDGIEIAPTRIFPNNPYEYKSEVSEFSKKLWQQYRLKVASIQSIWFGHSENIFDSSEERNILLAILSHIFRRLLVSPEW